MNEREEEEGASSSPNGRTAELSCWEERRVLVSEREFAAV